MRSPPTDETGAPALSAYAHMIMHFRLISMCLGYTLCSSSLMVANKYALGHFPFPSTLMLLQFAVSAVVVRTLGLLGFIEVEPLELERVRLFWRVPLFFEIAIYANIKLLQVLYDPGRVELS